MFCTHCGTQVADTDKFCPECGAPIERPATTESVTIPDAPPAAAHTPQPAQTYAPTPAPKKKSHAALWIALTCVALAIALAAIVIFVWRPWGRCSAPDTPLTDVTPAPIPDEEPIADLTPEETIRTAFERMNEAESLHMDFDETISLTIAIPSVNMTQNMDMSVVLNIDSDKVNGSGRIEGSISAMGFEQSVLAFTETVGGKIRTYSSTDGGATWTQKDNSDDTDNTLSNPTASVDLWMKHAKDFQKTGTEQINGFDTTVYAATLSGEYMKDAAGMLGNMLGNVDEAMLNDLGDFPIMFWIDNASGRIVRIVLDMRDMMETLLTKTLKENMGEQAESIELSVVADQAAVTCDMSRFNEIPPIVIPEEAKGLAPEPAPEPEPEPEPKGDSIVGTWELYGGEDEETQQYVDMMLGFGMNMVFVFNEDGTGSVSTSFQGEEDKNEFTYTLGNGEIVIEGEGAPYRIEDGLLYLTADSAKLVFKRK